MLDVVRFEDVNFRGYPQEPQLQWTPKSQNKLIQNYSIKHKYVMDFSKIRLKDKNNIPCQVRKIQHAE